MRIVDRPERHKQFLIILRGPAGSGKTSLARAVQGRAGGGLAVIDTDIFSWQIVPGESDKRLVFGNTVMVAGNYLAAGRCVIVCGLIISAEEAGNMRRLRQLAITHGAAFRDFYCAVPPDLAVERNHGRRGDKNLPESCVRQWWDDAERDRRNVEWELTEIDMRKDLTTLADEVLSLVGRSAAADSER